MSWQCALLQRWLPEYPDGDLPLWGKRWLTFHVGQCSACREELAELREVVAAIEAAPVADPAPEFWREFSRELHLKLVQTAEGGQAAPAAASPRRFRLPYLVGAPAVAVLLLWVAVQLTGPGTPVPDQALVKRESTAGMAAAPQKARRGPAHGRGASHGRIRAGLPVLRREPAGGGIGYCRLGSGCRVGGDDRPGKGKISQKTAST